MVRHLCVGAPRDGVFRLHHPAAHDRVTDEERALRTAREPNLGPASIAPSHTFKQQLQGRHVFHHPGRTAHFPPKSGDLHFGQAKRAVRRHGQGHLEIGVKNLLPLDQVRLSSGSIVEERLHNPAAHALSVGKL
eukprot:scaffold1704_cov246-Pinguiococcus_pyrenoidosus.AAC.1